MGFWVVVLLWETRQLGLRAWQWLEGLPCLLVLSLNGFGTAVVVRWFIGSKKQENGVEAHPHSEAQALSLGSVACCQGE